MDEERESVMKAEKRDVDDDSQSLFEVEFRNHKNAYYMDKLQVKTVTK